VRRPMNALADLDHWPEATVVSDSDIVVSGISLLRLVEVCGTPAVHSGATVIPDSGGQPSSDAQTAVLVVRVIAVEHHDSGATIVQVDARLDNLRLIWSQTRLLGRRSSARQKICLIVRRPGTTDLTVTDDVIAVEMPKDLRTGDLLAVPSRSIRASLIQLHPLTGIPDWRPDTIFTNTTHTAAPRSESID